MRAAYSRTRPEAVPRYRASAALAPPDLLRTFIVAGANALIRAAPGASAVAFKQRAQDGPECVARACAVPRRRVTRRRRS